MIELVTDDDFPNTFHNIISEELHASKIFTALLVEEVLVCKAYLMKQLFSPEPAPLCHTIPVPVRLLRRTESLPHAGQRPVHASRPQDQPPLLHLHPGLAVPGPGCLPLCPQEQQAAMVPQAAPGKEC